jgi:hypothetical protein
MPWLGAVRTGALLSHNLGNGLGSAMPEAARLPAGNPKAGVGWLSWGAQLPLVAAGTRLCYDGWNHTHTCRRAAHMCPNSLGKGLREASARANLVHPIRGRRSVATTNLVVDYLVIGIASLIWLLPALLASAGTRWLGLAGKAGVLGAALVVGGAYVLGICVSRAADALTDRWNDRIRDQVFGVDPRVTYHNRLNFIVAKSESASEYLSYRRSIVRISRACILHFALGAVIWLTVSFLPDPPIPLLIGVGFAALCAGACYTMISAWKLVLRGFFHTVKDMYDCLVEEE